MRIFRLLMMAALAVSMVALSSCLDSEEPFDQVAQFNKEQSDIDEYLTDKGLTAQTDSSGSELKYIIKTEGTGPNGAVDSINLINIRGTLLDGTEFLDEDSVYIRPRDWIYGYQYLVPYVKTGGDITMFIPSFYGYGQNAAFDNKVTPNSTLILDVHYRENLSQFEYEQRVIGQYLIDKQLEAEADTVYGLKYIITEEGTGDYPKANSTINVDYEVILMSTGDSMEANSGVSFALSGLIEGWKILLPYLKEGGSITMFLPSKYAYGTNGNGADIPPNATLIFKVKLNDIL